MTQVPETHGGVGVAIEGELTEILEATQRSQELIVRSENLLKEPKSLSRPTPVGDESVPAPESENRGKLGP